MTSYAIRVDENLKARAAEVAQSFGLDLASVTRAFWTYMVRTGSIPITFDGEQPNEESLQAIRESEEIFSAHARGERTGYSSAAEMFAALEA